MSELTIVYFRTVGGRKPFEAWFDSLGHIEAAKVAWHEYRANRLNGRD